MSRDASKKLWKKVCSEMNVEIKLMLGNWKYIFVHTWVGGSRSSLLAPAWTSTPGPWLFPYTLDLSPICFSEQEILHGFAVVPGSCLPSCLSNSLNCDILFYPATRPKLSLWRVTRGVFYGCGDLVFSSHMIFTLVFISTYHQYGTKRFIKQCIWLLVVIQSVLIIASRKHYMVDVVIAWYTVILLFFSSTRDSQSCLIDPCLRNKYFL